MVAVARSVKMKQVLEALDKADGCTAKEIGDVIGMESKEVSGVLKCLRLRGLVRIVETKSHAGNVWSRS